MLISNVESEYHGRLNATIELLWIQSTLFEFGFHFLPPLQLFLDNFSGTYMTARI